MPAATSTSESPSVPKVQQVLHVRAKSILSCTFARSAASNRGVAPPPSFQSVTINGVTTLLHINSHDGTVRTVGSIEWDTSPEEERGKKQPPAHKVTIGDHSGELWSVLKTGKGISKDLKFRSDTRAIHLPNSDSPLHFQRVAIPSGGFPYTVYTINDTSLPPGPTPAHTCVGQLTIKHVSKKLQVPTTTDRPNTVRLWAFFISEESRNAALEDRKRMVVRLELRTRDKVLIDKIVFSSLLVVAGKHPSEADSQVEQGRPDISEENEWDPPPALSNLATPSLTPSPSAEHLPVHNCPEYGDDGSQVQLLSPAENSPVRDDAVSDQSVPGPSVERSAVAA